MLTYPTVRKGLITALSPSAFSPTTSFPHNHNTPITTVDTVRILQDDQFPQDLIHDPTVECFPQQHPQLKSPFLVQPDKEFTSPASSSPSSPTFSSPRFSIAYPPVTVTASDYSADYDGSNVLEAPSMTPASSYNSAFHFGQPTSPSAQLQEQYPSRFVSPMLAQQSVASNHSWGDGSYQPFSPARFQNSYSQNKAAAPNTIPKRSASAADSSHRMSNGPGVKSLPTPVQTPVQHSFLAAPFQNYDPSSQDGSHAEAEMAMRRAIMEQQQQQQHQPQPQQQQSQHVPSQGDYSLAASVSTVSRNSPVTPQTTYDEVDEASKTLSSEYANHNGVGLAMNIPKLSRTISDIYQDELYNAAIIPAPHAQMAKQQSSQGLLTPYRNVFADRLQAANQGHISARSQSPTNGYHRARSPFRHDSPLAAEFNSSGLPRTSMALSQNSLSLAQPETGAQPKTISPKDALLDFHEGEDASMPSLFGSQQTDFNIGDSVSLRRESSSFRQPQNFPAMESFPNQYATQPAVAGRQQLPFSQQQQQQDLRQSGNVPTINHAPEFPASLPTMESTGSDHASQASQATMTLAKQPVGHTITRPADTSADGGTYTCTYHGCTLRFETPARLQRHKREAHRQNGPAGTLTMRDSARNSQAGPHKCERINPSTGKPCNSIFSRPYDLTRHEDTIHNARKQKVRCHLCTEEKTFSRNDALTRHMRVVHPEVDWPGKQRRRGGRE